MIVFLGCDGTVCEHAYPAIGAYNEGAVEVVEKLQKAGHDIIVNTYRADLAIIIFQVICYKNHLPKHH